uniref:Uncharacterized protein n=1 Tax=Oryza brachyantha TaxID=4533 RepID=J3MSZ9_ORYBR
MGQPPVVAAPLLVACRACPSGCSRRHCFPLASTFGGRSQALHSVNGGRSCGNSNHRSMRCGRGSWRSRDDTGRVIVAEFEASNKKEKMRMGLEEISRKTYCRLSPYRPKLKKWRNLQLVQYAE